MHKSLTSSDLKGRCKTISVHTRHDLMCTNPKDVTKIMSKLINKFSTVSGYKVNIKNHVHFCTLT